MRNPESFDAYYAETRTRFLLEAYALTGDVPAARAALRDAYVIAWHHWRKVALLDDRDAYVRSMAHRRARRRHKTRIWHRDKALDPSIHATFEALSELTTPQRRLLVLNALSPLSLSEIAREVGLPRADAERELQTATSQFSLDRDVPTTEISSLLEELSQPLEEVRWPRSTVIRRNGSARRRAHTVAGAGVAAAALLVSGSLVATGSGAQATSLSKERTTAPLRVHATDEAEDETVVGEDVLLASDQLTRLGRKVSWTETQTHNNLEGDGKVAPCQRERFSDPQGFDQIVRTWEGTSTTVKRSTVRRGGKDRVRSKRVTSVSADAVQVVELSRDIDHAEQSFTTASLWYAGCGDARTQLMSTRAVAGVGDSARQFRLRSWGKVPTSISVAVARTGRLVATTVVRSRSGSVDDKAAATALAAAVNRLCGSPGAGACAGRARSQATDPMAIGTPPGLLMAVDLPPVAFTRGPWVGTEPSPPTAKNSAATRCDETSFRSKGIQRALTRTFLFTQMRGADPLGLTQSAGLMKKPAAKKFVSVVASRVRACGAANLGTTVTTLASVSNPKQELHVWALTIELNDKDSFPFLMAIGREGNAVSQVGFTPVGKMTMSRPDFVALARRSLERLGNLPGATP